MNATKKLVGRKRNVEAVTATANGSSDGTATQFNAHVIEYFSFVVHGRGPDKTVASCVDGREKLRCFVGEHDEAEGSQ